MYDSLTPMQKLASLVCRLMESRDGLAVNQIKDEYRLDERTYRNYRKALKDLPDLLEAGDTAIEEYKDGQIKKIRIKSLHVDEETQKAFASFYLASSLMQFLSGTRLYEPMNKLANEFKQKGLRQSVRNLDKKLYTISEWPKNYKGKDDLINKIMRGVINQQKLDIYYHPSQSDHHKWHRSFKPYTVVLYRFGLYLVGESELRGKEIIVLAIDRINKVTIHRESFHLPSNYSPKDHFKDTFGIITEKGKHNIELLFDKSVARQLMERKYHESAKLKEEEDGSVRLTMKINSLAQVAWWILSFGSSVKVIGPDELKVLLNKEINAMKKNYS